MAFPARPSDSEGFLTGRKQPPDPRKTVESSVEAHDGSDSMSLHDRNVDGIPCGHMRTSKEDFPGPVRILRLDCEDLVDDTLERLEGRLDGVLPADGGISVQDFLENLCVCDQTAPIGDRLFQQSFRIDFVLMLTADQIHRDVRVDEDQRGLSDR